MDVEINSIVMVVGLVSILLIALLIYFLTKLNNKNKGAYLLKSRIIFFHSFIVMIIVSSCGVPQSDYDKLVAENKNLSEKIDECENGADKLVAMVEKSYKEKKYSEAKKYIKQLYSRHPESPKNKEFNKLLPTIEKKERTEQKRKEAEEKERIRLANINNTGIWRIAHYVDEFGEPTKQKYITNKSLIRGTFSNTATQDSKLDVCFLISNLSDISIQLYEYAGNNPVKAYSSKFYTVLIQDTEGKRIKLGAINYSERLSFNKVGSRKVHRVLLKGGEIKFRIKEDDTPTTQYEFIISKSDWYDNAYKKLKEK